MSGKLERLKQEAQYKLGIVYDRYHTRIQSGSLIPDEMLVCRIGPTAGFNTSHFNIRPQDFYPIPVRGRDGRISNYLNYPGRSASILSTYCLEEYCALVFDRLKGSYESLYYATVRDIGIANHLAYFFPLPNDPLHARIIFAGYRNKQISCKDCPKAEELVPITQAWIRV